MYTKFFYFTKNFLVKLVAVLGATVTILAFIDYLLKWKIYPYLFGVAETLVVFLGKYIFESLVLICLALLAFFLWRLQKQVMASRPNMLEKQIADSRTSFESQIKKVSTDVAIQIKNLEKSLDERIFDVERTMVDFEIESHRNKNQVGELSMMIKKFQMDKKRGWGAEDTLLEIREYIKKSGMPSYFLGDLNSALKEVSDSLTVLRDEVIKLAQERLYTVRG